MPIDQARAIIVEGRGTHFDPEVVAAFEEEFDALATAAQACTSALYRSSWVASLRSGIMIA